MSTKSTIWYGEDDKGRVCHFYWELSEREPRVRAPIYLGIEANGTCTPIRLPREIAQKIRELLEDPEMRTSLDVT